MAAETLNRSGVPAAPAAVRWRRYLLTLAGLLVVAGFVPIEVRGPIGILIAVLGTGAAVIGIRRHRPARLAGWWVLVGSCVAAIVTGVVIGANVALTGRAELASGAPAVVISVTHLLLFGGMSLIARHRGGHAGWSDLLDAALVAAAAFPLLWHVVVDPVLDAGRVSVTGALLFPLTDLLIFVLAVKLLLNDGLRSRTARWVAVAVAALIVSDGSLFVGMLATAGPVEPAGIMPVLWALHPAALGAAALYALPGEAAPALRPERADTGSGRLILLGALGMLVPLLSEVDRVRRRVDGQRIDGLDEAASLGPVVAVALLLVIRLWLVAGVAHRRAADLGRQTAALELAAREQDKLRQELTHRALHDPLTGLANRLVLSERMAVAFAQPAPVRHALLLLDLDGFKDVNDTLGHPVGDELLVAVAERLATLVPPESTLARLGGDEFALLLEDVAPGVAAEQAEAIVRALRPPYRVAGRQLRLSTSIGLLLTDGAAPTTPSAALRDADLALYAAKGAGKDRVATFSPQLRQERLEHSQLSAGLRRALADGELSVHYQPVVDLAADRVHAVEALVRWTPPNAPPVPPGRFIPIAEETGLIGQIGAWVLSRACADARGWYAKRGVAVSVNVSGRQVVEPRFAAGVLAALAEAGLPGAALIIEVTESSLIAAANTDAVVAQLELLRAHGIRIAIDDFGTGYSSLSYLAQLPVDILKIDSSFVRGGPAGPGDCALRQGPFVRAILQLSDALGLVTVAEGIETEQQAASLRELRCQYGQGYLFARPAPPAAIDELLAMPQYHMR